MWSLRDLGGCIITRWSRVANGTSLAPPATLVASTDVANGIGGASACLYSLHGCVKQYTFGTIHMLRFCFTIAINEVPDQSQV